MTRWTMTFVMIGDRYVNAAQIVLVECETVGDAREAVVHFTTGQPLRLSGQEAAVVEAWLKGNADPLGARVYAREHGSGRG
jgi:hypothetical protein